MIFMVVGFEEEVEGWFVWFVILVVFVCVVGGKWDIVLCSGYVFEGVVDSGFVLVEVFWLVL